MRPIFLVIRDYLVVYIEYNSDSMADIKPNIKNRKPPETPVSGGDFFASD